LGFIQKEQRSEKIPVKEFGVSSPLQDRKLANLAEFNVI